MNRILTLLVAITMMAQGSFILAQTPALLWAETSGPWANEYDGSFGAIAVHPTNPNILFIGSGVLGPGVFKSADGGLTWSEKNSGIQQVGLFIRNYPPISKIAFAPSNPSVIYVSTVVDNPVVAGGAGDVYRSNDGGESWQRVNGHRNIFGISQLQGAVYDFDVHPQNADIVYAGVTAQGIMKTSNGGADWATVFPAQVSPAAIDYFNVVRILPTAPDTVFFSGFTYNWIGVIPPLPPLWEDIGTGVIPMGLRKSTDGGTIWQPVPVPGLLTDLQYERASQNLYFSTIAYKTPLSWPVGNQGIYKSSNSGGSWQSINVSPFGSLDKIPFVALSANPGSINPGLFASSGLYGFVFATMDEGGQWLKLDPSLLNAFIGRTALAGNRLFIFTSIGIYFADISALYSATITGVSPRTLNAMPIGQRQWITITGTGFKSSSELLFDDGVDSYHSNPTHLDYRSATEIRYNTAVGPNPASWTVKVVNGGVESQPYEFYVESVTVELTGLTIFGPSTVNENDAGQFTATASYSDGSSRNVNATWGVSGDGGAASINSSSGALTAGSVAADTTVTVLALYSTGGITETATTSVTIANSGGGGSETTELIVNGGFETANATVWNMSGPIVGVNPSFPHGGSKYVVLGEANSTTDVMYQTISIPANATSVTLRYWLNIYSDETGTAGDVFTASLRNQSNTLLEQVEQKSNLNRDSGTGPNHYHETTFNLFNYRGQTVRIYFSVQMNGSGFSSFKIDDVSVTAVTPSGSVTLMHAGNAIHDGAGGGIGNGDGTVNAGEEIDLDVDLKNNGTATATGVSATLSTSSSYVTIEDNDVLFDDIASGGTVTSSADFDFTVSSSAPPGHVINFSLDIDYDQGSVTRTFSFTVGPGTGTPEIEVTGSGEPIASGSTTTSPFNNTDFDDHWIGETTAQFNFRIYNQGNGALTLSGSPRVRIDGSSSFTVAEPPEASVAQDDYTYLKIRFDPQSVGIHTATVRISSNDSGTPEYTFAIRGEGKFRDVAAPMIAITSPTAEATWSTSNGTLALSGQASDNVGLMQVTWSNDRGGAGTASGTTAWTVSSIGLQSGVNLITVAARDATNNVGFDTLTVTYTPSTPEISVSPNSLLQTAQQGENPPNQTFSIRNSGSGTLNYSVSVAAGADWLSVAPANGDSSGEQDTIAVTYGTTNLAPGTHNAMISVSAVGSNNSPITIPVSMNVTILPINLPYEAESAIAADTFNVRHSAVAQDGGILLVGNFKGTITAGGQFLTASGSEEDIFAVKLNASGQVVWVRQYGGSNEDQIDGCASHPDGGWALAGYFKGTTTFGSVALTVAGSGRERDAFLLRLDANGNVLWARRGGGSQVDYGRHSVVDRFGNCFLIGSFTTSATFSGGSTTLTAAGTRFDIFIAKYSGNGDFQWAKSAGGSAYDTVECAVADAAGDLYIGGTFEAQAAFGPYTLTVQGNSLYDDAYLAKWNTSGDVLWAKRFGETSGEQSSDYINFLSIGPDGSCFFGGSYDGTMLAEGLTLPDQNNILAAFVGKIDSAGTLQWLRAAPATSTAGTVSIMTDSQRGTVTADGGLIIGGRYQGRLEVGTMAITNNTVEKYLYLAKYDGSGNPKWGISVGNYGYLHYLGRSHRDDIRFMARFNQSITLPGLETIAVAPGDTLIVELGPPTLIGPTVTTTVADGKLVLTWPSTEAGFTLQTSTSLLSNSWTAGGSTPVIFGNWFTVTNPMTDGMRFFRLKK